MESNGPTELGAAIQTFRQKMETANKEFLNARIDEIQQFDMPESKKLQIMAHFWSKSDVWPSPGRLQTGAPAYIVQQREREDRVRCLEDVRTLDHYLMDGVEGPSLQTDRSRRLFIDELERVSNEKFTQYENDNDPIRADPELESFLKHADGIVDLDFRYSGICGFSFGPFKNNEDDNESTTRLGFRSSLEHCLLEETDLGNFSMYGLEARGGFNTGIATRADDWMWYSGYVYCRWRIDEGDDERHPDHQWKWRIVFWHDACLEGVENEYVFDGFGEFLEWYADWPMRVDFDAMRGVMYGDEERPSIFGDYICE